MRKGDFLKRYSKNIEIISLNDEMIKNIPTYWVEALSKQTAEARKKRIIEEWEKYPYQFQSTTNYLSGNLIDIELVKENDNYALLYSINNLAKKEVYYIGYNPLIKVVPDYFDKLPLSFRDIYNKLHNGWVFFASKSNGLSPIESTIILGDEDWGILDDIDITHFPFKLDNSIGLFHNGMGDYAAIDIESENKTIGFIWKHDDVPSVNVGIWEIIDEWTKIGIER